MEEYNENVTRTAGTSDNGGMTVGEWVVTMLILAIPFVNIIMLFVWGFGKPTPKRNYARANLIWVGISLVLMIIWMVFIGATIGAMVA